MKMFCVLKIFVYLSYHLLIIKIFIMKHSKVVNEILRTTDYSIFKYDKRNRPVNQRRVKQLVKSMREKGFTNQPIKVTMHGAIIDGQHRLEAAKIAKVPVLYFIDNSKGTLFEKAADSNRLSKVWSKQDYLHGLAEQGIYSYVVLTEFQKKYPEFRLTELMMMLQNNSASITVADFSVGKWKVNNVKLAEKWASNILKLKDYYPEYKKSIFVRSMIEIFTQHPEFNFDEFLHKVKLRPAMLYPCGTRAQYKQMVETIYNYHRNKSDKIRLRF